MIAALRRARRSEEGAIALATFAFMIGTGLVILFALWGIAYVTGAYNALYAANQSAAYAAATVTRAGDDPTAIGLDDQLQIACSNRNEDDMTICYDDPDRDDEAIDAAQAVLAASLGSGPDDRGPFGLYYEKGSSDTGLGSVRLVGRGYEPDPQGGDQITIYEISRPPADAKAAAEAGGLCAPESESEAGIFRPDDEGSAGVLVCWRLRESGISYPAQYRTGVVSRARAEVAWLPLCSPGAWLCPTFEMHATAAATLDRPSAPAGNWARYFD